ncbi:hypothetical protein MKZ38_004842 [Zalerion maritima]|uniref:Uncharacterized protein n=1 Tax=Zalerion maritima TaxID=339359 RepID=A0AAD5RLI2_9PEZI|nr:hypothetical protein MKZ38_004842 [Zalerion maritima]
MASPSVVPAAGRNPEAPDAQYVQFSQFLVPVSQVEFLLRKLAVRTGLPDRHFPSPDPAPNIQQHNRLRLAKVPSVRKGQHEAISLPGVIRPGHKHRFLYYMRPAGEGIASSACHPGEPGDWGGFTMEAGSGDSKLGLNVVESTYCTWTSSKDRCVAVGVKPPEENNLAAPTSRMRS